MNLSTEDAMELLAVVPDYDAGRGPGPCVHSYVESAIGLLGAHWYVSDIRALIEERGAQLSGEQATAMQHGLVVLREGEAPVFFETKLPAPTTEADEEGKE